MADWRPSFKIQQKNQDQSRLVSLPAEIRVKILRFLLKSEDGRVRSLSETKGNHQNEACRSPYEGCDSCATEYARQIGGAQMLRTCQKVFLEGTETLYSEQTITICVGSWVFVRCSLLNTYFPITSSDGTTRRIEKDELSTGSPEVDSHRLSRSLESFRGLFQRFTKVYVLVDVNRVGDIEIFLACRIMQKFLRGKSVSMELVNTARPPTVSWFAAFKVLRCKSIAFSGAMVPAELVETIQLSSEPLDTYAMWWSFKTNVLDQLPGVGQFKSANQGSIEDLVDAATKYEYARFQRRRVRLLDRIYVWNEQQLPMRIQEAQEDYARMKRRIEVERAAYKRKDNESPNP